MESSCDSEPHGAAQVAMATWADEVGGGRGGGNENDKYFAKMRLSLHKLYDLFYLKKKFQIFKISPALRAQRFINYPAFRL